MFEKDFNLKQYRLTIFCPAFILSELDGDIQIYSTLESDEREDNLVQYYLLGGQATYWASEQDTSNRHIDKITLVGSKSGTKIRVCGSGCLIDFSEPISIQNIGVSQTRAVFIQQINRQPVRVFIELGVKIELVKMSRHAHIFSRKITLRARQIFWNNTDRRLYAMEEGGDPRLEFAIDPNEKKPFFFSTPERKDKQKRLIFIAANTTVSVPLYFNAIGTTYFKLEERTPEATQLHFKLSSQ
jgi:hypothetical protein